MTLHGKGTSRTNTTIGDTAVTDAAGAAIAAVRTAVSAVAVAITVNMALVVSWERIMDAAALDSPFAVCSLRVRDARFEAVSLSPPLSVLPVSARTRS